MKAGTSILLIVLTLFSSFVGLGYFYSQFTTLHSENNNLKQQLTALNKSLAEERNANQIAKEHNAELTTAINNLQNQLANEKVANLEYSKLAQACQLKDKAALLNSASASTIVILPTILALLLAGVKMTRKTKYGIDATSRKKKESENEKVTIQITREQLDEYIKYRRKNNNISSS